MAAIMALGWPAYSLAYQPVDRSALLLTEGEPVDLRFHTGETDAVDDYHITDYDGRVVAEGRMPQAVQGELVLPLDLPAGYHEVVFTAQDGEQRIGLCSLPADDLASDGFLSIDAALSWLEKPEDQPDLIKGMRRLIGANGLARERLSWAGLNPAEERWDFSKNESVRRLYQENGIGVLEMFHDAPGRFGSAQQGKFPNDLIGVSISWSVVASRWQSLWAALEVWNEPDIGLGGNQPADQYVPLVKAIRYAMHSAGAKTPLGGGVFAAMNTNYLEQATLNGLLDECDFVSFHYYGNPLGLERLVGQYRSWLERAGHSGTPLWITEMGQARLGVKGVRPELTSQRETAMIYAMQAVEAKACGVARVFPFVYVDYSEHNGRRHYGMLDHDRSPLRVLAAVAEAGRALSGMEYIGDVPTSMIDGAARIRVFEAVPDSKTLLVALYTGRTAAGATVATPFSVQQVTGVDGRALNLDQGRVPVGDGLVYLRVARSDLNGILETPTEAMRLHRISKEAAAALPSVSSIVLQPQLDVDAMQAVSTRGYYLPKGMERLPVQMRVNNLGRESRTITVRAPGALEETIMIPAATCETIPMDIDLSVLMAGPAGDDRIIAFSATADNGERIGPASLTVIPSSNAEGIADHLKESAYQFQLAVGEDYRWETNTSGSMVFQHEAPAAWGFRVSFPPGVDRWAYPRFTLPQEVDQSRVTGVLLRARCLKPAVVRLMSWNSDGETSVTQFPVIPADGEWHTAYVPLASYQQFVTQKPGQQALSKLSVGLNSQSETNTLEISDLYVIGK